MRHVRSQLAEYSEGLLSAKQSKRVEEHIATCAACRDELVNHERMTRDLRQALTVSPRQAEITRWWAAIQSVRFAPPIPVRQHWWSSTAMIPTLLAVCVIVLPMLVGFTGHFNRSAMAAGTHSAPAAVVTNVPPTDDLFQTQQPPENETAVHLAMTDASSQLADKESTVVPVYVMPAPLAP